MGRILAGERLYIHCWGGHGRTGTLVALLLALLYAISADDALRYTQAFHDSRRFPQGVRSPQTAVQRAQVKRVINQATRAATPRDSWGAAAHTTTPGGVTSVVAERHPTTNEAPSLPAPGTPFRPASAAPSSARAWAAATRRPSDVRLPTPPSTAPEQAHQTPSFYSPSTSRCAPCRPFLTGITHESANVQHHHVQACLVALTAVSLPWTGRSGTVEWSPAAVGYCCCVTITPRCARVCVNWLGYSQHIAQTQSGSHDAAAITRCLLLMGACALVQPSKPTQKCPPPFFPPVRLSYAARASTGSSSGSGSTQRSFCLMRSMSSSHAPSMGMPRRTTSLPTYRSILPGAPPT